jgi:ADP-ribose pyrophosphatase
MPNRGKLVKRANVYAGRIVNLIVDEIEINGTHTIREVVRHPGGVVVLARRGDGRIPFVRQHRYPMDRDLLELPAGKLDPGEEPKSSAARELEEETGLRPFSLTHVFSFYTSPGYCDELLHLYYTDQVEEVGSSPEPDEELALEYHTLEAALDLIARGEILDGKTITAIYWLCGR